MKEAMDKFCKSRENGLFLLDMTTGSGKTFNVLEFIAENYNKEEYKDSKFFFITNLKKNLPFDELRKHFSKRGNAGDFDKLCMQIDANADVLIHRLQSVYTAYQEDIPKHIIQSPEFKALLSSIQFLNKQMRNPIEGKEESALTFYQDIENDIRKKKEPAFRKLLIDELNSFKTSGQKLKAIANEKKYQWIGELYPAVFTREKRIYFLSMDKFFLGNSTLIEPSYLFYTHKIIDNAVIFIDEFDSTKSRLLQQIIKDGCEHKINSIDLFTKIYSPLKLKEFPLALTTDSHFTRQYLEKNSGAKTCVAILEDLERAFSKTHDNFSMQYSFRTREESTQDKSRNFLFQDLQFHSIFSGDKSFMQVKVDHKAKQNWLEFTKEKPEKEDAELISLLSAVKARISYFQYISGTLARNYMQLKEERKKEREDDFTIENAVASVLNEFHLDKDYTQYLLPLVLSGQSLGKRKKDHQNNLQEKENLRSFERSVYERGFRYYFFEDDLNHNLNSQIYFYDFQNSPEKVLLHMAKKAKVIGISATASLDTVLGNYDLEYLQRMLQAGYYEMDEADQKRLERHFEGLIEGYQKLKIHTEAISYKENFPENLKEIFSNPFIIQKYTEKLEDIFSGKNKYAAVNFLRIIKALKKFIYNENLRSFLCLNNKLAQEDKASFDLNLIKEFATEILKEAKVAGKKLLPKAGEDLIFCLRTEGYEQSNAELKERLSKGEKIFVLSSYNTIGVGQNLQYKVPENLEVVKINQYAQEEKDFDGIYLEAPTHLIVNLDMNNSISEEDMVKFIFQDEFLMERGELSRIDGLALIKEAFRNLSGGLGRFSKKNIPYDCPSLHNYAIKNLLQAVGRICRTGLKNKEIHVYVDEDIFRKYDLSKVEKRRLNPEFRAIVELSKAYKEDRRKPGNPVQRLENLANHSSLKSMQIIHDLKRRWSENSIQDWRALRALSLKKPTLSEEEFLKQGYLSGLYFRAPEKRASYSYKQEGDYSKNIFVKFDDSFPQKMSEEEVQLQELLHISGLEEYFRQEGYATGFVPNEYLLTPPLFNNIYKGALGEVVGKYILEKYFPIELLELPEEHFELFDFHLGNGIYIDFKLWKGNKWLDATEEKEKILHKLESCRGKRAIVINILYDRRLNPKSSADGEIVEIPYLYRSDLHALDMEILKQIKEKRYLEWID